MTEFVHAFNPTKEFPNFHNMKVIEKLIIKELRNLERFYIENKVKDTFLTIPANKEHPDWVVVKMRTAMRIDEIMIEAVNHGLISEGDIDLNDPNYARELYEIWLMVDRTGGEHRPDHHYIVGISTFAIYPTNKRREDSCLYGMVPKVLKRRKDSDLVFESVRYYDYDGENTNFTPYVWAQAVYRWKGQENPPAHFRMWMVIENQIEIVNGIESNENTSFFEFREENNHG